MSMSVLYTHMHTNMFSHVCYTDTQTNTPKSLMLFLTGFGTLRTKLFLLTVSFGAQNSTDLGLVGTNPELPFCWKNSISIRF